MRPQSWTEIRSTKAAAPMGTQKKTLTSSVENERKTDEDGTGTNAAGWKEERKGRHREDKQVARGRIGCDHVQAEQDAQADEPDLWKTDIDTNPNTPEGTNAGARGERRRDVETKADVERNIMHTIISVHEFDLNPSLKFPRTLTSRRLS